MWSAELSFLILYPFLKWFILLYHQIATRTHAFGYYPCLFLPHRESQKADLNLLVRISLLWEIQNCFGCSCNEDTIQWFNQDSVEIKETDILILKILKYSFLGSCTWSQLKFHCEVTCKWVSFCFASLLFPETSDFNLVSFFLLLKWQSTLNLLSCMP